MDLGRNQKATIREFLSLITKSETKLIKTLPLKKIKQQFEQVFYKTIKSLSLK